MTCPALCATQRPGGLLPQTLILEARTEGQMRITNISNELGFVISVWGRIGALGLISRDGCQQHGASSSMPSRFASCSYRYSNPPRTIESPHSLALRANAVLSLKFRQRSHQAYSRAQIRVPAMYPASAGGAVLRNSLFGFIFKGLWYIALSATGYGRRRSTGSLRPRRPTRCNVAGNRLRLARTVMTVFHPVEFPDRNFRERYGAVLEWDWRALFKDLFYVIFSRAMKNERNPSGWSVLVATWVGALVTCCWYVSTRLVIQLVHCHCFSEVVMADQRLPKDRIEHGYPRVSCDAPSCCRQTKREGNDRGCGVVSRACKAGALPR